MFLERQFLKGKGSHFLKGLIFMAVGGCGSCLLRYKVTIMFMVALAWCPLASKTWIQSTVERVEVEWVEVERVEVKRVELRGWKLSGWKMRGW